MRIVNQAVVPRLVPNGILNGIRLQFEENPIHSISSVTTEAVVVPDEIAVELKLSGWSDSTQRFGA